MGLYNEDFSCPNCGREDKGLEEGSLMWSNDETYIYKCTKCGHLFSHLIKFTPIGDERCYKHAPSHDSLCPKCGGEVKKWDFKCPDCGTNMLYKCNYIDD